MEAAASAKVIPFPKQIRISTMREALAYGDGWQRAYNELEITYQLACLQRDASDLLLQIAEDELARVMGV